VVFDDAVPTGPTGRPDQGPGAGADAERAPTWLPPVRMVPTAVGDPVAAILIRQAEADICARYGIPTIGTLDPADFVPAARGVFLVAWAGGEPVGCGGIRYLQPAVAELKRLYVAPPARRQGLARRLLGALHEQARRLGYRALWLETGTEQPEAIALYRAAGYLPIAPFRPFGADGHDHRSRFFGIDLDGPVAGRLSG